MWNRFPTGGITGYKPVPHFIFLTGVTLNTSFPVMASMSKIERVRAVIDGEQPDRPPVSFWHHFGAEFEQGQPAVDAHLKFLTRFDLDFLKVMNDNGYPTQKKIESAKDLRDLPVHSGDEDVYALQLDLIRALSSELSGKVLLTTTIFNAWTVLRRIVVPKTDKSHNPPVLGQAPNPVDVRVSELLNEDRTSVAMALDAVAASQANFAKKCIEAGADGIFVSVRDDWIDNQANGLHTYDEMVRTGDGQIFMAAASARFNLLHVCGIAQDFDAFADYPIHVINWADRAAGPTIGDVARKIIPAICGGVDNLDTLPNGSAEDVEREVLDALLQAGDRPIMISAGCTYDPSLVPEENLHAMVRAARGAANC